MAQQLIEALSNEFDPSKYHDEYREQLMTLIDQKAEGAEIIELPERPAAASNVTDLMAALEASIAGQPERSGGRFIQRARRARPAAMRRCRRT